MGRGLKTNRGKARRGIAAALRHLPDLFEDDVVETAGRNLRDEERRGEQKSQTENKAREFLL